MKKPYRLLLLVLLAILIPIIPFAIIGELPGERWLSAYDNNAMNFALTGMGLLATDVLLPIPSSIIGTLLGARLGFLPGFLSTWMGLMLGNLIGYAVGRLLPEKFSEHLPQTPTLLVLFISRPVPVLAEAVTFTAGAARIPLTAFLLTTCLGNAIYAVALAGNGAALLPESITGTGLILPMLLPAITWLIWKRISIKQYRRKD